MYRISAIVSTFLTLITSLSSPDLGELSDTLSGGEKGAIYVKTQDTPADIKQKAKDEILMIVDDHLESDTRYYKYKSQILTAGNPFVICSDLENTSYYFPVMDDMGDPAFVVDFYYCSDGSIGYTCSEGLAAELQILDGLTSPESPALLFEICENERDYVFAQINDTPLLLTVYQWWFGMPNTDLQVLEESMNKATAVTNICGMFVWQKSSTQKDLAAQICEFIENAFSHFSLILRSGTDQTNW